jgi:hypothetical protein
MQKTVVIAGIPLLVVIFLFSSHMLEEMQHNEWKERDYEEHHLISTKKAKKDFHFFRQILEINHPGIYRWHSKKEITALMDSVEGLLTKPVLDDDFYKYLSIVNNRIGCSHSAVFYKRNFQFDRGFVYFPLPIVFINNSYYSNCRECDIKYGSKIISINQHLMSEVAQKLSVFNSVDANNSYVSNAYITLDFGVKYYYTYGSSETFDIKYEEPLTGKIYKKTINGIGPETTWIPRWHPFWYNDFEYNFKIYDSLHTALFQLRTFSFVSTHQDAYDNFLENTFQLLSLKPEIKNLVIDLRNNGGGETQNCYGLYSYLTNNDFYEDTLRVMNKSLFSGNLGNWGIDREVLDSIKTANYVPLGDTTKLILSRNAQKKWKKNKYAFKGNVFVITNYATTSAAIELASLLKFNENAIIIGEPTNGSYCSSNAYYIEGHDLSWKGGGYSLSFKIPLVYNRYNLKKYPYPESSPLIPDYFVPLTIPDFINDKDTQFDFIVKKLLK